MEETVGLDTATGLVLHVIETRLCGRSEAIAV